MRWDVQKVTSDYVLAWYHYKRFFRHKKVFLVAAYQTDGNGNITLTEWIKGPYIWLGRDKLKSELNVLVQKLFSH